MTNDENHDLIEDDQVESIAGDSEKVHQELLDDDPDLKVIKIFIL